MSKMEQLGPYGVKRSSKSGPRQTTAQDERNFRDNFTNITSKCSACGAEKIFGEKCIKCERTRS